MDMDLAYQFRLTPPAERVAIGISASKGGKRILNACLTGLRTEMTDGALLLVFLKIPLITAKVTLAQGNPAARQAGSARPRCRPRDQHTKPERSPCHLKVNKPRRGRSTRSVRRFRPR
jgi:DUF1365 family protein